MTGGVERVEDRVEHGDVFGEDFCEGAVDFEAWSRISKLSLRT